MKEEPIPFVPRAGTAEEAEQETVHEVYEAISTHFSQTRRKPWPLVVAFLDSLPRDTIGLDLGAGNGNHLPLATYPPEEHPTGPEEEEKYDLRVAASSQSSDQTLKRTAEARESNARPGRFSIALDHSAGLLKFAKGQLVSGGECIRGEMGFKGWRGGVFDWAINIAAIHHLTTHERRKDAVVAVIRPLVLRSKAPFSRFMLYVWAYEQSSGSKRKMGAAADSTPQAEQGGSHTGSSRHSAPGEEMDASSDMANLAISNVSGADTSSNCTDNHLTNPKIQDVLVPWVYQPPPVKRTDASTTSTETMKDSEKKLYHRYYHLFIKGELSDLVRQAAKEEGFVCVDARPDSLVSACDGGTGARTDALEIGTRWLRIRGEGYEADNWWLEGEVGVRK